MREGLEVERQDAGAFYAAPMQKMLSAGHAFFPVGFYYKWFTKPPAMSRFFLDRIRPLTGIGRLPGAGHAVTANSAVVATGTRTTSSIRPPAAVGFKPTI